MRWRILEMKCVSAPHHKRSFPHKQKKKLLAFLGEFVAQIDHRSSLVHVDVTGQVVELLFAKRRSGFLTLITDAFFEKKKTPQHISSNLAYAASACSFLTIAASILVLSFLASRKRAAASFARATDSRLAFETS